jgi:hypothetical protein
VSKWFLGISHLWENPQKFLFLKPNPLIGGMIAQVSLIKYFSLDFRHTLPSEPRYLNAVDLKDPRLAPTDDGAIEESRGHLDIPSPGVIRNSGTHFDQALDRPAHGSLNFFAPDLELPDQMQKVVGHNLLLQPGQVGLEALATFSIYYREVRSTAMIRDLSTF